LPDASNGCAVEYHDPHDVYKILATGLIPRLPLRDLNWQSHNGPVRSIQTLHVELVPAGSSKRDSVPPTLTAATPKPAEAAVGRDDGFQTASVGGRPGSVEHAESIGSVLRGGVTAGKERRHQIPGLRRTPYLKLLLVRCDDNETYKSTTRAEIREWVKANTPSSHNKPTSTAENHDAFEWLIVHVVLPNTTADTQPRVTGSKAPDSTSDPNAKAAASRWRGGSSTLLEKLRSDFNGSGKSAVDRVRQIRIHVNDVPYDILPRVVPAVPTGYHETALDRDNAWGDLMGKLKELILSSFDTRVTQYEEDIKERDGQRGLPGWNFCTFFILKEGLARGFESVGLVEDALVGYDELSVGLDAIIQEQAIAGSAEAHGGALLTHTEELKVLAEKALDQVAHGNLEFDEEAVDLQSREKGPLDTFHNIPISSSKKAYRELILANNVSLFDFRCYIFSRQISLLLRLGNASSTREELLAKLKELQELVPRGVASRAPMPNHTDEAENLSQLAEICRRTLEFVPAISVVARKDLISAMASVTPGEPAKDGEQPPIDPVVAEVVNNVVASFAFSVAQQILAQTSTKALPIPPSTLAVPDGHEPKAVIPEPKTMMHPARGSSLVDRMGQRPPPSPMGFPPMRAAEESTPFYRAGLEELAARRAELYSLSRNILEECGKKRGWTAGWAGVPIVGEHDFTEMVEISLEEGSPPKPEAQDDSDAKALMAGLNNELLRTALDNRDDFYRLYEILTDKALRHYTVASHDHSIQTNMADLAVLKFHLCQYSEAAFYFYRTIPFFGETGWSLLELSMLLMYARCLKELHKLDDYVNKALRQLLCKAAVAEKDRIRHKSQIRIGSKPDAQFPKSSSMSGFFTDLLAVSSSLDKEVRIPLMNFFCDVELGGPPVYDDGQDSFSVSLKLYSLIVDTFEIKRASIRITGTSGGVNKEIWLQAKGPVTIKPGRNKLQLQSSVMMAGAYEVDQIRFSCGNVLLHHERETGKPVETTSDVVKNHKITLYPRASSLDARLLPTKEVRLDKNSSLDLEISSGWNDISACEVKIRSATGGLRLLMSEATVIGPLQPSKRTDSGAFTFGAIPEKTSIMIRFPFSVENDLMSVAVKAEVSYVTANGDFTFSRTSSVPITLALGVNVQDVFKHDALFSRFTVSTATASPLRILKSELLGSEMFESHFGRPPSHPIVVFPKQPASLLYKVKRRAEVKVTPKKKQTLHLKLYYSVVHDEIEALFEKSITEELKQAGLQEFSKLVVARALSLVRGSLTGYDLEKATLLGDLKTDILAGVRWEKQFPGLGYMSTPNQDGSPVVAIANFMGDWLKRHPKLQLPHPDPTSVQPSTIVIPVDVPPITIVHTADIQFQEPLFSVNNKAGELADDYPTVCTNQLLPATLHLKWTRIWDTAVADPARPTSGGKIPTDPGGRSLDLEFGYEITAPPDTWLLGGRRKGHFVIPAMLDPDDEDGLSSTPETEADIPLLLIPLREGWLPFPNVDIREVKGGMGLENGVAAGNGSGVSQGEHHCETDYRNLGETVHVIADRGKVTLSLDASGPGGGPLMLECERVGFGGRVVA